MNNVSTSSARILCVDDDQDLAATLSDYLTSTIGASVQTVFSVNAALRLIDQNASFDLIVSDYQLPPENGDGFYRALRERGSKTPFVFYSGFAGIDLSEYRESHFLGLIEKPELRKLVDLVRYGLSRLSK